MRHVLSLLIIVSCLAPGWAMPAFAVDELKLQGSAYLDEEACAKGLQGKDCVLSFFLEGQAAKTLYEGIKGKAKREECTGGLEKSAGGLRCLKYEDGTYACDFGFGFGPQKFGGSHQDC